MKWDLDSGCLMCWTLPTPFPLQNNPLGGDSRSRNELFPTSLVVHSRLPPASSRPPPHNSLTHNSLTHNSLTTHLCWALPACGRLCLLVLGSALCFWVLPAAAAAAAGFCV